jgi:hypothetical protein
MRPVSKGNVPNTYPIDVSVASEAQYETDARGIAIWTFTEKAVTNAFGSRTPSALDLVQGLRDLRTYTAKKRTKHIGYLDDAKGVITRQLSNQPKGYKQATAPLSTQIGKICSYCEQFLPDDADLEHCVPKAEFPYTWIAWPNFLFACGACNGNGTGKGTGPDRDTAADWDGGNNPDEIELYDAVRDRYFWPDIDSNTYRAMYPRLWYLDNNKWKRVPDADSVAANVSYVGENPEKRIVTAKLNIGGAGEQVYQVQARLKAAGDVASRTVPYFGLDQDGTKGGSIRDMRMYNRTLEWLTATELLKPVKNANDANSFNSALNTLAVSLRHRSFFSVWMRVATLMIGQNTMVPGGNQTVLKAILAAATVAPVWPGTNPADVP